MQGEGEDRQEKTSLQGYLPGLVMLERQIKQGKRVQKVRELILKGATERPVNI